MVELWQFLEFLRRVNFENHIPTDNEIRIFMAKNALAMPHLDTQMVEVLSGSGYIESVLRPDVVALLNPREKSIISALDMNNRKIPVSKGKMIVLPHPFYVTRPDPDTFFELRHRASTEL